MERFRRSRRYETIYRPEPEDGHTAEHADSDRVNFFNSDRLRTASAGLAGEKLRRKVQAVAKLDASVSGGIRGRDQATKIHLEASHQTVHGTETAAHGHPGLQKRSFCFAPVLPRVLAFPSGIRLSQEIFWVFGIMNTIQYRLVAGTVSVTL